MRPARSTSAPTCSAICLPSGLADTPADHTLQADSLRRVVPSESLTVNPSRSTSTTRAPSCISTPSFCSRACAFIPSLAPIGATTDDGERQQLLPEGRIAAQFGQLERAEDAPAHFERIVDRLHARRELREMVVTEIGLARPGRDDQAVVRRLIAQTEQL